MDNREIRQLLLDIHAANIQILKNQRFLLEVPVRKPLISKEELLNGTANVLRLIDEASR